MGRATMPKLLLSCLLALCFTVVSTVARADTTVDQRGELTVATHWEVNDASSVPQAAYVLCFEYMPGEGQGTQSSDVTQPDLPGVGGWYCGKPTDDAAAYDNFPFDGNVGGDGWWDWWKLGEGSAPAAPSVGSGPSDESFLISVTWSDYYFARYQFKVEQVWQYAGGDPANELPGYPGWYTTPPQGWRVVSNPSQVVYATLDGGSYTPVNNTFSFSNYGPVTISASKEWKNTTQTYPVELALCHNEGGSQVCSPDTVTLDGSRGWTAQWTNQYSVDEAGNPITYTVVEKTPVQGGWTSSVTESSHNNWVVTNTAPDVTPVVEPTSPTTSEPSSSPSDEPSSTPTPTSEPNAQPTPVRQSPQPSASATPQTASVTAPSHVASTAGQSQHVRGTQVAHKQSSTLPYTGVSALGKFLVAAGLVVIGGVLVLRKRRSS